MADRQMDLNRTANNYSETFGATRQLSVTDVISQSRILLLKGYYINIVNRTGGWRL